MMAMPTITGLYTRTVHGRLVTLGMARGCDWGLKITRTVYRNQSGEMTAFTLWIGRTRFILLFHPASD